MIDFLTIMNLIKNSLNNYADLNDEYTKTYDLSTDEGLDGYNKQLDLLEKIGLNELESFGIDANTFINEMREIGQRIHDEHKMKNQKKENQKNDNKEQKTINQAVNQMISEHDDKNLKFTRPSELLNVQQKLQLHKIVQEYVDTVIKPFNNGVLTNDQINDAYAGLYEFAAWVMKR